MEQPQNHCDKMYHKRHHKNTGSIEWPWLSTPTHTAMHPRCGRPPKVTYPGTSVMELDVSSSFPTTHTPAPTRIYEIWHVTLVLNNNIKLYDIELTFTTRVASPYRCHPQETLNGCQLRCCEWWQHWTCHHLWQHMAQYPSLPSDASTGANSQPRGHWVGFGHWFHGICTTTTTTTTFYQLSFIEWLPFNVRQGWKNQCWGSNPTSLSSRCGTHWGVGPHCDNPHTYKWSGVWWWRDGENPMGERDLGQLLWWVKFGHPLCRN